jgi:transcriptional regulator with XRE-family HTH domain
MSKPDQLTVDYAGMWERIREALGAQTAPEVARALDLSRQTVYDWQKGKIPGLDTLVRIADLGNVSLHWLVTGEGPSSVHLVSGHLLEEVKRRAGESGVSVTEQLEEIIEAGVEGKRAGPSAPKMGNLLLQMINALTPSERHTLLRKLQRESPNDKR